MAEQGSTACAGLASQAEGQRITNGFGKPVTRRVGDRPRSKLFTHMNYHCQHRPSYMEDYGPKPLAHTECVRSGTSSGNRRNNPHPGEAFMVWRLPSRFPHAMEALKGSTASLHPQQLLSQQQITSTYQDDYTGMQQNGWLPPGLGQPGKSAFHQLTYSLASSMRQAYQTPQLTRNLKGNTTRYGCSVDIVKPACGVVPTLHPHFLPAGYQTWYSMEFGGSKGTGVTAVPRPPTPRPGQRHKMRLPVRLPPINGHTQSQGKGRGGKQERGSKASSLSGKQQRSRKHGREKVMTLPKTPIWLSEWTGPM